MRKKTTSSDEDRATAERLLDTAERLFGAHGLDGVGMRTLAAEAGVNLGAATYHFGSKEALYLSTFMRRFRPTNAARLQLLKEAEARAGKKPVSVENIVECLIRPPFESGKRHPGFRQFLARNLFMPPPFLRAAIQEEIEPIMTEFIAALQRSLPNIPVDLLRLRAMLSMGALLVFVMQAPKAPAPNNSVEVLEGLIRELVGFVSAGLQCEPATAKSHRPSSCSSI